MGFLRYVYHSSHSEGSLDPKLVNQKLWVSWDFSAGIWHGKLSCGTDCWIMELVLTVGGYSENWIIWFSVWWVSTESGRTGVMRKYTSFLTSQIHVKIIQSRWYLLRVTADLSNLKAILSIQDNRLVWQPHPYPKHSTDIANQLLLPTPPRLCLHVSPSFPYVLAIQTMALDPSQCTWAKRHLNVVLDVLMTGLI